MKETNNQGTENPDVPPSKPTIMIWETSKCLIFAISSAIITSIAVRNSENPLIHKLWDAARDLHVTMWDAIFSFFGRNGPSVVILGSTAMGLVSFITVNMLFMVCDVAGHPAWLLKYKVQDGKNQPVEQKKWWKCLRTSLFNLVVTTPLFMTVLYPIAEYLGAFHRNDLPSFERFIVEFAVFNIVHEVCSYYIHRLLHTPYFYVKYHKLHHEWTAPIGIANVYCGVVEMVALNLFSLIMGPLLMQSHLMVIWIWTGYALVFSTIDHGGYHVPFLYSPEAHDYHHKESNCNYGTLGILDMLHNTNHPFAGTINAQRHYVSCSLKPIKEIHPDPRKPSPSVVKGNKDM